MPYSFSALKASTRDWMASPAGPDQACQRVTFTPPSVSVSISITGTGVGVAVAWLTGGGKFVTAGGRVGTEAVLPGRDAQPGVATDVARVAGLKNVTLSKRDR